MARHIKWEADEVVERITTEFVNGIADIDELLAANRDALDDLARLISA